MTPELNICRSVAERIACRRRYGEKQASAWQRVLAKKAVRGVWCTNWGCQKNAEQLTQNE